MVSFKVYVAGNVGYNAVPPPFLYQNAETHFQPYGCIPDVRNTFHTTGNAFPSLTLLHMTCFLDLFFY